jgi:Glycosyltransferase family 25 (LPS biosynthesis protein)
MRRFKNLASPRPILKESYSPAPPLKGMDRIDKVFYINLDSRKDRLAEIENELNTKFNYTTAERMPGIMSEPGIFGCTMSHIILYRRMILEGWDTMMVIEDDAMLVTSREILDHYIDAFLDDSVPDIFCIANSCGDNEVYNESFKRCFNTQTTACYIVKRKFIETLIACYFKNPEDIMNMPADVPEIGKRIGYIDCSWFPLQKTHYFMMPNTELQPGTYIGRLVVQRPSYSDIVHKHTDYKL